MGARTGQRAEPLALIEVVAATGNAAARAAAVVEAAHRTLYAADT